MAASLLFGASVAFAQVASTTATTTDATTAATATTTSPVATTTSPVATTTAATVPVATALPVMPQPAPVLSAIARFSGTISGASAGGFNLVNSKGRSIAVIPAASIAVLVNEQQSSFASLLNGMQASVYGTWAGSTTTISASLVNADLANTSGTITNVNGMGFTVTSGTHSINVTPASSAVVVIDHTPSSASALTNGMTVSVYGTWTDSTHATITGTVISATHASVGGKVGQVGSGQFVVVNSSGKQITVNSSPATTILKSGVPSAFSSILDGAPVSAYGTWTDSTQSTLNASSIYVNGNGNETTGGGWCYTFYNNLRVGSQGADVYNLQIALNQSGFIVPETSTYDQSTASAVSGFQEKYASAILIPNGLTYGTGYVGTATRNKLNALYACPNPINAGGNGSSDGGSSNGGW